MENKTIPVSPVRRPVVDGDDNAGPSFAFRKADTAITLDEDAQVNLPDDTRSFQQRQAPVQTPEMVTSDAVVPEGYTRLGLPSNFVPYNFSDVLVRRLTVGDLIALSDARADAANVFTRVIDVLDRCVNVPMRRLTGPDQKYIMYWLRIESFTKSPYKLSWISRYGNKNEFSVDNSSRGPVQGSSQWVELKRQIVALEMTKERYAEWRAKGLAFPTVRDAEALDNQSLSAGQRFALQNAQYVWVDPDSVPDGELAAAKIAALEAGGIEMLEDIQQFANEITHGVDETVIFTDEHFEPKSAVQFLREQALTLTLLATTAQHSQEGPPADPDVIMAQMAEAEEYRTEADEIEALVEKGGVYQPRKESVTLKISVASFFS